MSYDSLIFCIIPDKLCSTTAALASINVIPCIVGLLADSSVYAMDTTFSFHGNFEARHTTYILISESGYSNKMAEGKYSALYCVVNGL